MDPINQDKSIQKKSVIISGGSGLIGRILTDRLLSEGYMVSHLSRKVKTKNHGNRIPVYYWNPEKKEIDPTALKGVNYIINLAGANIGEKRWSKSRKDEIIASRVNSARFLFELKREDPRDLEAFISASATGYYGAFTFDKIFEEEDLPSTDFLGNTCRLWEQAADLFLQINVRTVKIRTAVVLHRNGGVLSELLKPAEFGLVIRSGSGNQYMPWIHIEDLCNIYIKSIKDTDMSGAYNAVSPFHTDHNNFMRILARVIGRHVFLPPVPSFILKLIFGEMSGIILEGSRVSSKKIIASGYKFLFPELEKALNNIISGK
jgi:uncharacterized protein